MLWLGAGRVEALQCVARAESTGQRCQVLVSQSTPCFPTRTTAG